MNQENAEDLNEIGSLSSGSLEPPPDGSEDQNDDLNNDAASGNDDAAGGDDNDAAENPAEENDSEGRNDNTEEENPKIRGERTQATPVEMKTNIDARLTQARESYTRDASRQRSKDVGVLSTKFRQFRVHLNELKPIIKSYQQANKERYASRTKVSRT